MDVFLNQRKKHICYLRSKSSHFTAFTFHITFMLQSIRIQSWLNISSSSSIKLALLKYCKPYIYKYQGEWQKKIPSRNYSDL